LPIAVRVPHGEPVLQLAGLNVQLTPLVGEISLVTVAFTVTAAAAASIAVNGFVMATTIVDVIVTLNIVLGGANAVIGGVSLSSTSAWKV
jgi:hypothetical protein